MRWRIWPQKVRTRLALLYAALFLISGSALLGLTYGLVAASLPAQSSTAQSGSGFDSNQLAKLKVACRQPHPDPGTILACKRAFSAGAGAGAASVRERALDSLLLFSLLGLGVMTVASGGLGWYVSGRVLRPVRAITETARRASDQHLGERLALTGAQDELKELADTFDDMLERLDQAFAAQRRFVANASHELRTPLTVMRTAIDVTLAKPNRTTQQLEDMAARIRRSIDRAENMIEALLVLAISDQGVTSSELLDLSAVAEDALELAAPGIARLGLSVRRTSRPPRRPATSSSSSAWSGTSSTTRSGTTSRGAGSGSRPAGARAAPSCASPTAGPWCRPTPCRPCPSRSAGSVSSQTAASASGCRSPSRSASRTGPSSTSAVSPKAA